MAFFQDFEKHHTKPAALDAQGTLLTYADLAQSAAEIGRLLPERALIFSFCQNTAASMAGYLAFLCNRMVPLMLAADIDAKLRENLIRIYQPAYLYLPEKMRGEFPHLPCLYEKYGYALLKNDAVREYPLHDDLALLLTTSGSTGSPKLVRQSYRNIQSNAEAIAQYLELDETERPVTTLPMNYTYGLSIINSHVLAGACVLLTEDTIVSKSFWDFMKAQRATSFGGVPYTYEMLKRVRFFKMDLPDLKTMTQAGGKLSPELHKEFAGYALSHGKRFIVMYGQTEATARMAYLPPDMALEKYGSMGIPIPGGRFSLIGDDGNRIATPDTVGELVYEGDNVTLGYAERGEDLKNGDERHGRLETGDMAKMDADGYYYIVGRRKRFLKLFGNRMNLDEIERMVKLEFENLDCAASGTDERMNIFITDAAYTEAVENMVAERTHLNGRAFAVFALDAIPRSESGKILYTELPR